MEKLLTSHQVSKLLNIWPHGKRGGRVAKKLTELIGQEVAAGEDHG